MANDLCGDDRYCLFDVAATERIDVGQTTKESGDKFQTLLSLSAPGRFLILKIPIHDTCCSVL